MENKNGSLTVNGPAYIAPIFNTGPNPTFGVINHPSASPVIDVKDAAAEIPPEVDENWHRRMPEQLSELMALLMYEQCDSESVPLFLRKRQEEQERQVQEQERRMRELDQERRQFTEAAIKIGKEHAALQAEREAFEEEKRSLQTQTLLSSLSETPCSQKAISAPRTLTMSLNTASVNKSCERSSPVSPPRANKHPRQDSSAVQENNYRRRQDTSQPQPTKSTARVSHHPSVVSQGVEENLKPSAPASQNRSGKMVSKMQLLQSVNAKCKATGAPSPTPTSTSSRSLASVATKAASAANALRQQPVPSSITSLTCSTSNVVLPRNSPITASESSESNSSRSTALSNRKTSDRMPTALGKKVAVASAAQEEAGKSKIRGRVSSRPSVATTWEKRE